ncbi:MAG TPA: glycosyl hydrolase [Caproiciproducens sp.]|nr:glycosyl hydrolase [Caproiciproducens sp.]
MNHTELAESFQNPAAEYRGKIFWSWNGKLEKDELFRQMRIIKEMGYGGFYMHSRTGLKTEYLGREWFELINACAEEARKYGLEAWLYDEDRWPSGSAGGKATENPKYRMKSVQLRIVRPEELVWDDSILAAFSCCLNGESYRDCRRITAKEQARAGQSVLLFRIVTMKEHSFYNGNTYLDTMNREATDWFLKLTHEKYRQFCGERLGKAIRGVFTDEPHRGTLMDYFGAGNESDNYRAPWTDALPDEFRRKYGYDLVDSLPELFLMKENREFSQVKWHYVELLEELFLKNFFIPIHEWCEKNHMILTGHGLQEDSLTSQTVMTGSIMRIYQCLDEPGVDVLTEGNRNFWVVKQLASTARQLGKKGLLSELYGCTGWQMNFERYKEVGDWQALFGINRRCIHLAWYTMEGEAKRDYPASMFYQSAWYPDYKYVEDYFARIGVLMGEGKPCCEILVLNPVESVWGSIRPGWANNLNSALPETMKEEQAYQTLFHWLCGSRLDFDYGDEAMIAAMAKVEKDENGEPVLRVGESAYKTVVAAGMTTIRSTTLQILRKFLQAGGKVVFVGDEPCYVDALPSVEARALPAKHMEWNRGELLPYLTEASSYRVDVEDLYGNKVDDIYCQIRRCGEDWHVMLLNINREAGYGKLTVRWNLPGMVCEWYCASGERRRVQTRAEGTSTCLEADFSAGQEHLYVVSSAGQDAEPEVKTVFEGSVCLHGPYRYRLSEPNVCVFDLAEYKTEDQKWSRKMEILQIDCALRRKFGLPPRGGDMVQPWFSKTESSRNKPLGTVQMRYTFLVQELPREPIELAMEHPGEFTVLINRKVLDTSVTTGWWVDPCYTRVPVPADYLVQGENEILVTVQFYPDINLEAFYLLGQFGVRLKDGVPEIGSLPLKIPAGNLVELGLPFYSGKITYEMPNPRESLNGNANMLMFGKFEAACLNILGDRGTAETVAWKPYTAKVSPHEKIMVEAVLTRRNTFGPLHQLPLCAGAYGPENFTTEGKGFTTDYVLYPAGLLEEPKLAYYSLQDESNL